MSNDTAAPGWKSEPFNDDEDTKDAWDTISTSPDGLPAFVDEDLQDELDAAPHPEWLGIRWRDIDDSDRAEAWTGLRQWVDWFAREYNLTTSQITPCWFEHADMVAELYAAMCAEYKAWDEGMPGLAPMTTWHPHVQALKSRLAEMVSNRQCAATKTHEPDPDDLPFAYDQNAWVRVRDAITTTTDLPRTGIAQRWRPVTTAKDGTPVTGRELLIGGTSKPLETEISGTTLLSGADARTFRTRHTLHGAATHHWEKAAVEQPDNWTHHSPEP